MGVWKNFNLVKDESMKIRRVDRQRSRERNNRRGKKKELNKEKDVDTAAVNVERRTNVILR